MGYLVDIQKVWKAIELWHDEIKTWPPGYSFLLDTLKAIPPADGWIPCEERMPEEDLWTGRGVQYSDSVLMNVYNKSDDEAVVDYGLTRDGEWYSMTADEYIENSGDWEVNAWMPLPEPYNPDTKEEA